MNEQTLNWLLEDKNPAIKYRTLTEICDKSPEECQDVYNLIWEQKSIVNMMNRQDEMVCGKAKNVTMAIFFL